MEGSMPQRAIADELGIPYSLVVSALRKGKPLA
jgi:GTP-sensing pleiotropic transcriptional regulator CodY